MITIDLQDALRALLGSYRVQLTRLNSASISAEISSLNFRFRDQLYEGYDYPADRGTVWVQRRATTSPAPSGS